MTGYGSWVTHPSTMGYRRQGSSGGGIHGTGGGSLAAVAPEFDSGMNAGTSGDELGRVSNFYDGAEENPTAAQSAPTPRGGQLASGLGLPGGATGGGPSINGIIGPRNDNEPAWTAGINPYSGHGSYNRKRSSFWPFGGGGLAGADFGVLSHFRSSVSGRHESSHCEASLPAFRSAAC